MPQPVLSSFAQRLYDSVQPVADQDSANAWALANFCAALGSMFQLLDDYGRDQEVNGRLAPGWSQVLDLNRAPTAVLPWLAQFVGVQLTSGLTDPQWRAQMLGVNSQQRGTKAAMIAAAQATLTGTKTVTMTERNGGAYNLSVSTRVTETPNAVLTLAALLSQKPAGIVLTYQNITGQTYGDLFTTNAASYQIAFTEYLNYQQLLLNNQGSQPSGRAFGDGTFGSGTFGGN